MHSTGVGSWGLKTDAIRPIGFIPFVESAKRELGLIKLDGLGGWMDGRGTEPDRKAYNQTERESPEWTRPPGRAFGNNMYVRRG
jgi:hypothetical protein